LRFSLTTVLGRDFEGGHFELQGIDAAGHVVDVPVHRHEVSLDYTRFELGMQYTLSPDWDLVARLPWEEKAQTSVVAFVDPATPEEHAAMLRNADVHHRTATYRGLGDGMLLGRRRWTNVWREDDLLSVTFGSTVPIGRTEENPYLLGDQGLEHRHIQFGTGTFDPIVEASYAFRLTPAATAGAYLAGRIPLYENARTFHAPFDTSAGINASYALTPRVTARAEAGAYYQGYGEWNGLRDENTGLVSTSAVAGLSVLIGRVVVGADVRVPLTARTLSEGDAFKQGPTFVFTISGPTN
jgi:hypothetical protein